MLKSKIRNKLLKTRKNSNKKNIQIKFDKIYKLLKKTINLRDKIMLDNIWYLNHFNYHDVVHDSKFFERLLRWYGEALPTELANYE